MGERTTTSAAAPARDELDSLDRELLEYVETADGYDTGTFSAVTEEEARRFVEERRAAR